MNPTDYMKYDFRFACEECSHYASDTTLCTLGYKTAPHRKAQQQKDYEISGTMALCRFHEID